MLRRTALVLVALAAVLGCILAGVSASDVSPDAYASRVILIGWDGAQRNHVRESMAKGELPNLSALASEGALVAIDVVRTTDTKAGWAEILTGYAPEVTGVFSNRRYEPIPKGYTVFERLERFFGPDNFVTVALAGKSGNVDADGPRRSALKDAPDKKGRADRRAARRVEGTIEVEDGVEYRVVRGKPFYNARPLMDVFINGLGKNEAVGAKAVEYLDMYKDKPFFFFVHFADVDEEGHRFGENSVEYGAALVSCDLWTGRIMDELRKLGIYDRTLIYVTADHGFDEGRKGHSDAPYVFLATNDPKVIRRGERADIAPTILERFGLDLTAIKPPLTGHSLTRAYAAAKW